MKLIDIAQEAPKTIIVAEDEAKLYLQATTTRVWSPRGHTPVARLHPGRDKVNFYGSVNLKTGQDMVMRSEVMNSEASARHLEQVLKEIHNVPILLLWDRAPWHFGQAVKDVLSANPRLEIIYFPVASPDLNPQEHVWKATRCAVSHNHIIRRLPELADRFERHLESNVFESSFLDNYGFNAISPIFN